MEIPAIPGEVCVTPYPASKRPVERQNFRTLWIKFNHCYSHKTESVFRFLLFKEIEGIPNMNLYILFMIFDSKEYLIAETETSSMNLTLIPWINASQLTGSI